MSYNIQDLLKSVQDGAPASRTTTDDIVARALRNRARRTAATVAAGAVACLAVAVTAFSALGAAPDDAPAAGRPAASAPVPRASASPLPVRPVHFTTDFGTYRAGAYQVGPVGQVTAGYVDLPVYRFGETWRGDDGTRYPLAVGTITVYRPGRYNPGSFTFDDDTTLTVGPRYPVSVHGRAGIGLDMTHRAPGDQVTEFVRSALAWQYADDAWATFVPQFDHTTLSRADAVQIAAGLVTTKQRQLKAPYGLGFLPRGWQAVGLTQTDSTISSVVSVMFLHQGPVPDPATRVDEVLPGGVQILTSKGSSKDPSIDGHDGLHCYPGRGACTIIRGDYFIAVKDFDGVLSDGTVRQIAEGLKINDLADQNTWVPVGRQQ